MTLLVVETTSFTIGAPMTPVLRRNFIRADVPSVDVGTTVVVFVSPDEKGGVVPADLKPVVLR